MEGDPGMDSVTQLGEGEARSLRTRLVDLEALLGIANDEIRSAENTVAAAMGQVEELLEMSKTVEEECTTAVERVEQDVMKGVEKDFADLRVKHDDHHESRWEEYHRTLRLETDALKAGRKRRRAERLRMTLNVASTEDGSPAVFNFTMQTLHDLRSSSAINNLSDITKIGVCLATGAAGAVGLFATYQYIKKKSSRTRSGSLVANPDNHLAEEEVLQGHEIFRHDRQEQGEMIDHAEKFLKLMNTRRSIRFYSKEDVPLSVIMTAVRTACTAPSGAHLQPWTFVIVQNQQAKERIRDVVEREEQLNYDRRMRRSWVKDATPMVGDLHRDGRVAKPYLSEAPYLVVMMKQNYRVDASTGDRQEHYYVEQSCGIAAGMLICALHNAGLVTLTSTPMGAESAIRNILNRPANEKVYLLMPVGYPSSDATVPKRTSENRRRSESDTIAVV
ncbi:hypothetical protein FOZ61_010198 [Perkinsus olseni]|uniref:Nitroreductase domain-containing protein n=1 Tax=Perkinsus olseni TaxID=32597 RepID=A0A7J6M3T7_PEROL|nr:hypothetical protein FOZ61_010198 [Perkinsus olseni]